MEPSLFQVLQEGGASTSCGAAARGMTDACHGDGASRVETLPCLPSREVRADVHYGLCRLVWSWEKKWTTPRL
jgi:hypothetical protein